MGHADIDQKYASHAQNDPETREGPSFDHDRPQSRSSLLGQFCAESEESAYLDPCVYCGMPGDSIDHIPSKYMRLQLSEVELRAVHTQEVTACRECNSILGCRPILTIVERRQYVKSHLKRKYAKYLRIPEWTDEKLATMSLNLQGMIRRGMKTRNLIRQRLQWPRTKEDTR